MENLESFRSFLAQPRKVVITMHVRPDADALGSSLGLAGYLQKGGHQTTVVAPTDYPDFLKWMSGNEQVFLFEDQSQQAGIRQAMKEADLIACLDFSTLSRIEELGEIVRNSGAKKLNIDHHLYPEDFADWRLWNVEAAATAELVYDLILMLEGKAQIDVAIGECLYAGMVTDTGSFRHPTTSSKVHRTIAELIDIGIRSSKIHKLIYDNNAEARLRLLGHVLVDKLRVLPEYHTAYITLSEQEIHEYGCTIGDTEGMVNYALSIKGITMAAILMEQPEKIKISFRSVGDFSVNEFARQYFDGGGHKNAAGGSSQQSLRATEEYFLSLLPQYQVTLNQTHLALNL